MEVDGMGWMGVVGCVGWSGVGIGIEVGAGRVGDGSGIGGVCSGGSFIFES